MPIFPAHRFVLALLVMALLASCAHGLDEGRAAIEASEFERAESIALAELHKDRQSPWANLLMAETRFANGDADGALPFARRASPSGEFPLRTALLLGDIHAELNQPGEAASAYHRAREIDAGSIDDDRFESILVQAITFANVRRDHTSEYRFRTWLADFRPAHPEASPLAIASSRRAAASILSSRGEYLEAIALLEEALAGPPETITREALDLGELYARMDMVDDARETWEIYLDPDTDREELLQRYRDVIELARQYNHNQIAIAALTRLIDEADPIEASRAQLDQALFQLRDGDTAAARETLTNYLQAARVNREEGNYLSAPYQAAFEVLLQTNQTRLAIQILEEGTRAAAPSRVLTRALADIYARRAQMDAVEDSLDRFIERHPDRSSSLQFAGNWAQERNNFELAAHYLRQAAELPDAPAEVHFALAQVFIALGEDSEVSQAINAYLRQEEDSEPALLRAAELFTDHRYFEDAERLLIRLRRRDPESFNFSLRLANLYRAWSRSADAASIWDDYIRRRGNRPPDMIQIGQLLTNQGDLERAAQLYRRSGDAGQPAAYLMAADIYLRQDHQSAMVAVLEKYLETEELSPLALTEVVARYERAGLDGRQIELLTRLIRLQPDNWRHHEQLAGLLIAEGNPREALQVFERYVQEADNPFEALELISQRASAFPPSLLVNFYLQYAQNDDIDPRLYRLIGDAYYLLSQETFEHMAAIDEARRYYDLFLEHAENLSLDWRTIALEWTQRPMWGPALKAYERYIAQGGSIQLYAMGYAETLLQVGQFEEAEGVLQNYFQREGRRPNIALRIARLLQNFRRYDATTEYARLAFVSGNDDAVTEAFVILAELFRQQEDLDSLAILVDEYPRRTSNRSHARTLLINVLESQGHYEQALHQVDRLPETLALQSSTLRAFNRFRLGDTEGSFAAFEDATRHSPTPGVAWVEAGSFFHRHGATRQASLAFERALQAAPDDLAIRTTFGVFQVETGQIDAAMETYQFGLRFDDAFSISSRLAFFRALAQTGYFPEARQVAESIDLTHRNTPAELALELAAWDLRSPDEAVREDAIRRLHNRSWSVHDVIQRLNASGLYPESHELILEEFRDGDPTTASRMLISHAPQVAFQSGWNLHQDLLANVIDPFQRTDLTLLGPIGDHRARRGQLQEAQTYLQAAVDHANVEYLPQLATTHLLNGDQARAADLFEKFLLQFPEAPVLEGILLRYELAGAPAAARHLLDRLLQQPALIHIALPLHSHYALEQHGDPHRAIDEILTTINAMQALPGHAFHNVHTTNSLPISSEDLIAQALVSSLETVAALGFLDVVEAAIADAEILSPAQAHRLAPLRLKLTLARDDASGAINLARTLIADAGDPGRRQNLRVSLARDFIAFGVDAPARAMVDAALSEETTFRNHQAFTLHLGLLLLEKRYAEVSAEIDRYLEHVPNRYETRRILIDELRRLSLDQEALRLVSPLVAHTPTPDALRQALITALDAGDRDKIQEYSRQLIQIADRPFEVLQEVLQARRSGTEPFFLLPLLEEVRLARPASLEWLTLHIHTLFRDGQMQAARSLLIETLESRHFDREVVTHFAEHLHQERRDVELARVLAPLVPDDALWPQLLIYFAGAEFALGFPDRADNWLNRLDEFAPNSNTWHLVLANDLVARRNFSALHHLLDHLPTDASSPHRTYLEGLAALSSTNESTAAQGLAMIRQANSDGMQIIQTHLGALIATFESGHHNLSRELMQDLTDLPLRDNEFVHFPLHILLRASLDHPDGPRVTLDFLESHRPRLLDGRGATWSQFAGLLASALERTGDPEGAFGFYRDRIWHSRFSRQNDASLPIYLNNLAYTYSTTGQNLDEGFDTVRRALILANERNSSYIDTYGWLLYRSENLDAAEAEVRRALRDYQGPPQGLRELMLHLRQILEDRQIYDQAAWLDAEIQRLPISDIEF